MPFEWLGAEATGFVSGVIQRDPAIPTGLLRRLAGRLPPLRARENRRRAGPAGLWSGWLEFLRDKLLAFCGKLVYRLANVKRFSPALCLLGALAL